MPEDPDIELDKLDEAIHDALAALTRNRPLWWGSMVLGRSGIALSVLAFLG